MWPWEHLGFGYLLYSGIVALRGRTPTGRSIVALAVGTQFPDIVDKPLAWWFGVLPSGRSLAHSVVTMLVVVSVVFWVARRREAFPLAGAFAVGYASHLVGDAYRTLLSGDLSGASFLLWPILPSPEYASEGGFVAHFRNLHLTPGVVVGIGFAVLAVGVWVAQGSPGSKWIVRLGSSVRSAVR